MCWVAGAGGPLSSMPWLETEGAAVGLDHGEFADRRAVPNANAKPVICLALDQRMLA
jgi:hypothetical protein